MSIKELTKNYYKKLSLEAWLKSMFIGFAVGCGVDLIYSVVSWFFGFKMIFLSLAILFAVSAVATVLFYYLRFRPTEEQVARRLDELGLEERIITYNELKDDNSYIAQRQREDAVKSLSQANTKLMKFIVSVPLAIVFGVSIVVSVFANVFTTTSKKPGKQVFEEIVGQSQAEYLITYRVVEVLEDGTMVEGGGFIDGDMFQIVAHGESATPVTVIPDEGYTFSHWDYDMNKDPYRELEQNVTADNLKPYLQEDGTYLITAVCYNIDYANGEGEGGEGSGGEPNDDAPPMPPQEGEGGEGESGDGKDGEGQGDGDGQGQGAGGGKNDQGNQIIDGETFYGDGYDDYKQNANDRVDKDGDLDSDKKGAIGDYMDAILPDLGGGSKNP